MLVGVVGEVCLRGLVGWLVGWLGGREGDVWRGGGVEGELKW